MRISIGSDHGGYALKQQVVKYLQTKYEVVDYGCDSLDSCDYPIFAKKVANDVSSKASDFGVLICTTGIGMSIMNEESAHLTRMHNNSNVICMGAKFTPYEEAVKYLDAFLEEQFEGGRHQRRVDQIED